MLKRRPQTVQTADHADYTDYANSYLKHVAKKFQKPSVPVYDKTKKEIISMAAGKSVDMTDINHGHTIVN